MAASCQAACESAASGVAARFAKRGVCTLAVAVLLVGVLSGCGGGSSSTAASPVGAAATSTSGASVPLSRAELIGAIVQQARTDYSIPGAAVGVWTTSGETVVIQGLADPDSARPLHRLDRFAIRSVTKSFTVTLILQLVDAGSVGLDDPVSRYVPGVPSGDLVTIRMLAGMRSGLADYSADPAFVQALNADPTRTWTTQELLGMAFGQPMKFTPGTQYQYCNTNTLVLGEVVEAVTHQAFDVALQERLLTPLGLDSTLYLNGSVIPPPSSPGFDYDAGLGRNVATVSSFSCLGSAGALASSLDDCHAWADALGSGRLISPASQAARLQMSPATNGPEYDEYGLGMGMVDGWIGHTGHGLGYEACVFYDPVTRSSMAILLNASNGNDVPVKILRRISPLLRCPD